MPFVVGTGLLFLAVGLSPVVAIGIGLFRYRPEPALPWVLFAVAQMFAMAAAFCFAAFHLPVPSYADGLYIAFYPFQAAGLLLLIRSRNPGKDLASLIDALIITVGLSLLSWVYLIKPNVSRTAVSQLSHLIPIAYPVMDVLLLAVAVRMVMGNGARPRAFYLMATSILCLIATDAAFGAIQLNGSFTPGGWLDLGWMAAYILWGAAALHPSMRELSTPTETGSVSLSGKRLALLAAATLIAPAMLLANSTWPIPGFDVPVAAGAAAVMFILVIVRMLGLVSSEREAVGRHARAERHESVLRHAATALAVAPDRQGIRQAAVDGARSLAQGLAAVEIAVEIRDSDVRAGGPATAPEDAVVIALSTQTATYGWLVVASSEAVPADVIDGLRNLGSQVAMALEAASFTERFIQQRREAWVGALVQNSSDVIMVLDDRLSIRYVTPSVLDVLGYSPAGLVGESLLGLVELAEAPALTAFFSPPEPRPGTSSRAEWRMRRGDGSFTDIEVVSTDLLTNPGVNGIVVTARDISERKALEVGLKRQVSELEELDRMRSEFVATVSHELRTPLTNIIGVAELFADGDLGELAERQAEGLEVIGRNSERLLLLVEDLLTLSHMETNALQLHLEPTPVMTLVDDMRTQVSAAAVAKSVELLVDCCPQAGTVFMDREQMGRAMLNLLTNAVKFTPAGGTVDLRATREGEELVVTVSDTGMGIPIDEQAKLFTRFFRSTDATRMAIQGTGLGLVIVKRIIEEHGGTISIASTPDVGTSVTVKIPAAATIPPPRTHAA
ncbi:MAG: aminotransferase class [Marmoricola sp.]|nr:aminotransferase class [Marmoricola sp.]